LSGLRVESGQNEVPDKMGSKATPERGGFGEHGREKTKKKPEVFSGSRPPKDIQKPSEKREPKVGQLSSA